MQVNLYPAAGSLTTIHTSDGQQLEVDVDRIEVEPMFSESRALAHVVRYEGVNAKGRVTDNGMVTVSGKTGGVRITTQVERRVVPLIDREEMKPSNQEQHGA